MLKPLVPCLLLLCATVASGLASAAASAAPASPVVSTQWLADHMADPKLVLLQVGSDASFATGHIPGARRAMLGDLTVMTHANGEMTVNLPSAEALRQRLIGLGISDDSHIVVAFSDDWVPTATRVVFTLQAAGLGDRTSLLDGGQAAWQREHHPTTAVPTPPPRPGNLAPLRMQPVVVDAAFVQSHLKTPGYVIVDSRAQAFYDGIQRGGEGDRQHAAGHIPGAKSLPYTTFIGTDSKLKSGDELQAIFQKAGVKRGDTVVAYCHIGLQATTTLLEARRLGVRAVLYGGSFQDWSARSLPVEGPASKADAR